MCDTNFDEFELPPNRIVEPCLPKCNVYGPERNYLDDVDCEGRFFCTGILLIESCFTDMNCPPNGGIMYHRLYCLHIPGLCVSPSHPLSGYCAFMPLPMPVTTVSLDLLPDEMELEGLDGLTGREDTFELFEDTDVIHIEVFWNYL